MDISMKKTSLSIDRAKAGEAARILNTRTLTATVDAALREVIDLDRRRRLIERVRRSKGGIGPSPGELARLREP